MNDHATKPLEENLQLIDPRSDPVSWNLNKALLERSGMDGEDLGALNQRIQALHEAIVRD